MQEKAIIEAQLSFFKKGSAGCLFAAHAAKDPKKFGWELTVCDPQEERIEEVIQSAITTETTSTQSILFPSVLESDDLRRLLVTLKNVPSMTLEQEVEYDKAICLGYRVQVGSLTSWATGFGGFDFLPRTRQAIFTEITFRSKPRPKYDWVMKETPPGIIHLADMDMKGMSENKFKSLWFGSFAKTEELIGRQPDLRSAAKTTFAVPIDLWRT